MISITLMMYILVICLPEIISAYDLLKKILVSNSSKYLYLIIAFKRYYFYKNCVLIHVCKHNCVCPKVKKAGRLTCAKHS